jgi:hypothetical protein
MIRPYMNQGTASNSLDTAVLMIIFNRPDNVRKVLECVRAVRPKRLYVAADGPRTSRPDDQPKAEQSRAVIEEVDWPCEVKTWFREENLGCGRGPSTAVSWMLEHEPYGIILEDDCLPVPSFFHYAEAVLQRYEYDDRVSHVNGNNYKATNFTPSQYSYHFVAYPQAWGWATWRRAWQRFDIDLDIWPGVDHYEFFQRMGWTRKEYQMQRVKWNKVKVNNRDIWDFQWQFYNFLEGNLVAAPKENLVTNIGFDKDATHTGGYDPTRMDLSVQEMALPVKHPPYLLFDGLLNQHYKEMMIMPSMSKRVRYRVSQLTGLVNR